MVYGRTTSRKHFLKARFFARWVWKRVVVKNASLHVYTAGLFYETVKPSDCSAQPQCSLKRSCDKCLRAAAVERGSRRGSHQSAKSTEVSARSHSHTVFLAVAVGTTRSYIIRTCCHIRSFFASSRDFCVQQQNLTKLQGLK